MPDKNEFIGQMSTKHTTTADGTFVPVVAIDGGSIQITGPVTVSSEVEIKNDSGSPIPTEPLGVPTVAHQLAATTTSQSQALSAGCRRVSIRARGADIRYVIGVGAQTASATTSHFIAADERLDWAVPAGAHIARIRDSAATADGSLAVTEIG